MSALPPDYDSDPDRWGSNDASRQKFGDVHDEVARRIIHERLAPVLDVGGGQGKLTSLLPAGWSVVIDSSPAQLARAVGSRVRADAIALPVRSAGAQTVSMLWMLYHLDDPVAAIAEAKRVLRPGGLFVACTSSRHNDPELTDEYPRTTFDAEEAESVVRRVFSEVSVESWDAPMTQLPDRDAVVRYCRSHLLPAEAADRVTPPVWLTKRGCAVYARR